MRIYVEVQPSRFKDKLVEQFKAFEGVAERLHVPDAPMGYPKASSLAISALAIARGARVTAHLRTIDYSTVGFLNQVYGAHLIGVDRILLLRGDPPFRGSIITDVSPEHGLELIRSDKRLESMKVGFILSLRHPVEKIRERLALNPDFVLITHKSRDKVSWLKESYRGEKIGYLIVEASSNLNIVRALPQKEDICKLDELSKCIDEHEEYLDAVVISCPEAVMECAGALKKITKR